MKHLHVNLKKNEYTIYIKRGLLDGIANMLKEIFSGRKIVIITDENVDSHYGDGLKNTLLSEGYITNTIVLPPGEGNKSFSTLEGLYELLIDFNMTRSDLLIALGGGVIGDLTGFLASTYLRGIPYVQVPTSLLAQVDSSVGGKVAVDLKNGKNLVGSFYHPKAVYIDPNTLNSLTDHFFKDGMAEVIKYGCIFDGDFFTMLENLEDKTKAMDRIEDIIYTCCNLKSQVVEDDELDKGNRMKLNFGHTLGHAIEAYYGYKNYSHGEAVAIGMVEITKIAEKKGLSPKGVGERIENLLKQYQLPINLPVEIEKFIQFMVNDKKNIDNNLKLILLEDIGESFIYSTDLDFFKYV